MIATSSLPRKRERLDTTIGIDGIGFLLDVDDVISQFLVAYYFSLGLEEVGLFLAEAENARVEGWIVDGHWGGCEDSGGHYLYNIIIIAEREPRKFVNDGV